MEAFPAENGAVTPDLVQDPALGLSQREKLEILGAVLLGLFLGALDQTVVGTALPRIVTDLGGNEYYTWVVTIYLLTSTITVPFYGKLSDLFGRRPLLMIGITTFLVGSALSGLSQNMGELIFFRGLQGIGAGSLFPISLAVIGDLFTPAERGKYQGLFGAVFGVSFIVGPALGGFLTDHVAWNWVFYVNIPIGIISLFVIWRLLPNIKNPNATRNLDYLGALIFTVAIGFLLVGLTNKSGTHLVNGISTANDWTDFPVGGFIAVAVVLLLGFLAVEARAKEPIVPLDLWRGRTYAASMISTFFVSFAFFGAIIFLPRWFQVVRHESATNSGYLLFPLLIGLIGSSIISGFIVARTGRYKPVILIGLATTAVGIALMTQLQANTAYPPLWAWMFVTGVGIGPTLAVFTIAVQNAVPFSKLGVATSNLTFFRQIGGSVGLAISGTIFATQLTNELPGRLVPIVGQVIGSAPADSKGQVAAFFQSFATGGAQNLQDFTGVGQSFGAAIASKAPANVQSAISPFIPQLDAAFFDAFTRALSAAFVVGIATTVVALIAAFGLKEIPLRRTMGAPAPAAAGAGPGAGAVSSGTPSAAPTAAGLEAASSNAPSEAPAFETDVAQPAPPATPVPGSAPSGSLPESSGAAFAALPTTRRTVAQEPGVSADAIRVGAVAAIGAAAVVGVVAVRGRRRNPITDFVRGLRR
jgi:EmrB/QacA subfamily drug resistance transporter